MTELHEYIELSKALQRVNNGIFALDIDFETTEAIDLGLLLELRKSIEDLELLTQQKYKHLVR